MKDYKLDTSKPIEAKLPQIGTAANHGINGAVILTALIAWSEGIIPAKYAGLLPIFGMVITYGVSLLAQYSRSPHQVTVSQAFCIAEMCHERGLSPTELIHKKFGEEMKPDQLTKKQGSRIIEYLKTIPVRAEVTDD